MDTRVGGNKLGEAEKVQCKEEQLEIRGIEELM